MTRSHPDGEFVDPKLNAIMPKFLELAKESAVNLALTRKSREK